MGQYIVAPEPVLSKRVDEQAWCSLVGTRFSDIKGTSINGRVRDGHLDDENPEIAQNAPDDISRRANPFRERLVGEPEADIFPQHSRCNLTLHYGRIMARWL